MLKLTTLNIKKALFITVVTLFTQQILCQNSTNENVFMDRVRFGGGIGLGFGNNYFNGSISPSAIYQVNEQFSTGIELNFNYAEINDSNFLAYGASALSFYDVIPEIQLSAEIEQLRISRKVNDFKENYWNPALFLGIGYVNRNFTVGIQYNILHDNNKSIYTSALLPFVRVYF